MEGRWLEGREEGAVLLGVSASPATGGEVGSGDPSGLTALFMPQDTPLLTLRQNQQWISLETLAPDTLYELQVRARPQLGNHEAWSPWSQPLVFRTRPAGTEGELGWGCSSGGRQWLVWEAWGVGIEPFGHH